MSEETIWIEGARVVLRDPESDDVPSLAYWLQPEQRWQEMDGPYYFQPDADEIARILGNLRDLIASRQHPRPRTYLSIASIDTNELLGQVTCSAVTQRPNPSGLNIVIYNADFWGYGLGYEAFGLWAAYLFTEMPDMDHLELRTWSGNTGMIRLAHKLGFVETARYRRSQVVSGRRFDGLGFSLTREEWGRRYPDGFGRTLVREP